MQSAWIKDISQIAADTRAMRRTINTIARSTQKTKRGEKIANRVAIEAFRGILAEIGVLDIREEVEWTEPEVAAEASQTTYSTAVFPRWIRTPCHCAGCAQSRNRANPITIISEYKKPPV